MEWEADESSETTGSLAESVARFNVYGSLIADSDDSETGQEREASDQCVHHYLL